MTTANDILRCTQEMEPIKLLLKLEDRATEFYNGDLQVRG